MRVSRRQSSSRYKHRDSSRRGVVPYIAIGIVFAITVVLIVWAMLPRDEPVAAARMYSHVTTIT